MPDSVAGWPFWLVFALLFLGAMLRGQGTYWLGRFATVQALRRTRPTGGWQLRAHEALMSQGTQRGVEAIRRWGLLVVPVAYLTVGFQTMVMAGAGVLRIGWPRFTLAQVPGALAWAGIYSTIGFAVWGAALAAAAGSPWALAGFGAIAVVVVATLVPRLRRRLDGATPGSGRATTGPDPGVGAPAPGPTPPGADAGSPPREPDGTRS